MSGMPGPQPVQKGVYPQPESDSIEVVVNVQPKGAGSTLIVTKQRIRVENGRLVLSGPKRDEEISPLRFT